MPADADNKITLIPDGKSFEAVRRFGDDLAKQLSCIPKAANRVSVAIDEIYSNIVKYSGADMAEIEYKIADGKVYIMFADNGAEYNPLAAKEPDITLSAEGRKIGGLGIFVVRKLTEDMEYKYEGNKNILKLAIALE